MDVDLIQALNALGGATAESEWSPDDVHLEEEWEPAGTDISAQPLLKEADAPTHFELQPGELIAFGV